MTIIALTKPQAEPADLANLLAIYRAIDQVVASNSMSESVMEATWAPLDAIVDEVMRTRSRTPADLAIKAQFFASAFRFGGALPFAAPLAAQIAEEALEFGGHG